jgi:hypothetical protein
VLLEVLLVEEEELEDKAFPLANEMKAPRNAAVVSRTMTAARRNRMTLEDSDEFFVFNPNCLKIS